MSHLQSARECLEYATSQRRDNGLDKSPVPHQDIQIRALKARDLFYAIIFPVEKASVVGGFWATPGVGISSRFAEVNMEHIDLLTEVKLCEDAFRNSNSGSAHDIVRRRIIDFLTPTSINGTSSPPAPSIDDVYLYPSGMASIYKPHTYLSNAAPGKTVLFGMAFMNTIVAFEDFGDGIKFFGLGNDQDLDALETFLEEEAKHGRKVQAIWAELPANPILVTPDLVRLNALARQYNTILAIDDTIGSFANIDVLGMTDMLVTSLTKSFNGYADAIAGSVVLNPASPRYPFLKTLFEQHYIPELYTADAEVIERNSRDYLPRTTKHNTNAAALVSYFSSLASSPSSSVLHVHYPSLNPSGIHYKRFMRPSTPTFTPGYGCLFNVEFEDMETTIAFYENLNLHKGPHLGAPTTLVFAYTMCAYKNRLEWAGEQGLRPTQLRIAVGLEDVDLLLEECRIAVEAADKVKAKRLANDVMEIKGVQEGAREVEVKA